MFKKVLIANRGEIACRIMRSCREMGIETVAVYSDADKNALHVELADNAYPIGPAPAAESYLVTEKILDVALTSGAEAIHPGYGFLSENADFAEQVAKAGLVFIGPDPDAIRAMGGKSEAKALMEKAGVPLVPGYHGDKQDLATLQAESEKIGFPVVIKASAGGGGKGMRVVNAAKDFSDALDSAKREAKSAFGNDHVLIEKYLTQPRHVEIQIFGDQKGDCVYLFERDCSIQRRHQKVVEEAPAPGMSDGLRAEMGAAAIAAAKAIDYKGAGTVEFLLDEDGSFYFMEMNTRLQVEHPVTEEITGVDLVEWQLRIAYGESLPMTQDALEICGHAIEVRLYAEDPQNGFLPAAGKIRYLRYPVQDGTVRIESAVREAPFGDGEDVSIHYDPMIAKLITCGQNRTHAINNMIDALEQLRISGLKTNLGFLQNIMAHPAFQKADLTTGFADVHAADLIPVPVPVDDHVLIYAALGVVQHRLDHDVYINDAEYGSPWNDFNGWSHCGVQPYTVELEHGGDVFRLDVVLQDNIYATIIFEDGRQYTAMLLPEEDDLSLTIRLAGEERNVSIVVVDEDVDVFSGGHQWQLKWHNPLAVGGALMAESGKLTAPMPGKIVAVKVSVGDQVEKGQPLVILEAMKMEHTITAPEAGEIIAVNANPGDQVDEKLELVSFS